MSRLDFMIDRLIAQRMLLADAARLIAGRPGCVFELGLGSGRTYDHLRNLFPIARFSPSTAPSRRIRNPFPTAIT